MSECEEELSKNADNASALIRKGYLLHKEGRHVEAQKLIEKGYQIEEDGFPEFKKNREMVDKMWREYAENNWGRGNGGNGRGKSKK